MFLKSQETVQIWQEHENILNQIRQFIEQTVPVLEARLRLSNLNAINQEIVSKEATKDQLEHALKGMELAMSNMDQLSSRSSKEGMKKMKDEHADINGKLQEVNYQSLGLSCGLYFHRLAETFSCHWPIFYEESSCKHQDVLPK